MLVSQLVVMPSAVVIANPREAARLATDKYVQCNHQTLPRPLTHSKTEMDNLPVNHSGCIERCFPSAIFTGLLSLTRSQTNQAAPAILPLPHGCSSIFRVQRQAVALPAHAPHKERERWGQSMIRGQSFLRQYFNNSPKTLEGKWYKPPGPGGVASCQNNSQHKLDTKSSH